MLSPFFSIRRIQGSSKARREYPRRIPQERLPHPPLKRSCTSIANISQEHTLAPPAVQASTDGYRTAKESGNSDHPSSRIYGATAVGTPPSLHPQKTQPRQPLQDQDAPP